MQYKMRPVYVEAHRWNGELLRQTPFWIRMREASEGIFKRKESGKTKLLMFYRGDEHVATAYPGDYIVRNEKNEVWISKSSVFEETYEPLEERATG